MQFFPASCSLTARFQARACLPHASRFLFWESLPHKKASITYPASALDTSCPNSTTLPVMITPMAT